jgi:hypothetical protein
MRQTEGRKGMRLPALLLWREVSPSCALDMTAEFSVRYALYLQRELNILEAPCCLAAWDVAQRARPARRVRCLPKTSPL